MGVIPIKVLSKIWHNLYIKQQKPDVNGNSSSIRARISSSNLLQKEDGPVLISYLEYFFQIVSDPARILSFRFIFFPEDRISEVDFDFSVLSYIHSRFIVTQNIYFFHFVSFVLRIKVQVIDKNIPTPVITVFRVQRL